MSLDFESPSLAFEGVALPSSRWSTLWTLPIRLGRHRLPFPVVRIRVGGRFSPLEESALDKQQEKEVCPEKINTAFGRVDRSYMRLTEKEDETLPIDIVLQTLLAFAVTCYGIVHIAGEFKDMDATSELKNKTFDTLRNHPSFYVFNHRGRVLFQPPDAVHSSSNQDVLSSSASLKFRKLEPLRR
nr:membrane magnesium transporter 1 [Pogona vitticeps]